jgi:2-polyprenyl-3-methyl-5-hydroxy-6-metoxy-1,4-benzoquinol methylase
MHEQASNDDKAGKEYWDSSERNQSVEFQPFGTLPGVRGFGRRAWHQAFLRAFGDSGGRGRRLLELGCGGSAFLPYFARQMHFDVCGIDYSEGGCELAREMCRRNAVDARIICADFFRAPKELSGTFDAVVSFGVVEHFTDTASTIAKFSEFLRPGGILLTVVPNMRGLVGAGQRLLNRKIYDTHEVISPARLAMAHRECGLRIIENGYFLFTNFGVINPGMMAGGISLLFHRVLKSLSAGVWAVESVVGPLPGNSLTSPYVWCVARAAT